LAARVNFRDIGGLPGSRWPANALGPSLSIGQSGRSERGGLERLDRLGLKTLVDFRLPMERRLKPNRLPPAASIAAIELGFVPDGNLQMPAAG